MRLVNGNYTVSSVAGANITGFVIRPVFAGGTLLLALRSCPPSSVSIDGFGAGDHVRLGLGRQLRLAVQRQLPVWFA